MPEVLVVDDEPNMRGVLAEILRTEGFDVVEAEDGQAALDRVMARVPAAIILDIRMPGLDGIEVLGKLKEIAPQVPVIMLTGYPDIPTAVKAMRVGARDYLTKPFHAEDILLTVRRALEWVEIEERLKQSHAALLAKTEELERANQALREAQAQLVEKERLAAVGQVVVGLHHAILNPLAGIHGALQVLKQEGLAETEKAQAFAQAEAEIRKLERLIRRLATLRRATGIAYVGDTTMLDLEPSGEEEG